MIVVNGAMLGMPHFGKIVLRCQFEKQGDIFQKCGLIFLDGQQIVSLLVNYLRSNLGLGANGVNSDDTAADIQ